MEAAENAVSGAGLIILNEAGGKAGALEGVGIEYLSKPPSIIAVFCRLDYLDVLEFGFEDLQLHLGIMALGYGSRIRIRLLRYVVERAVR